LDKVLNIFKISAKYYKKIVNLNSNKKQQSINSASQSFDEALEQQKKYSN